MCALAVIVPRVLLLLRRYRCHRSGSGFKHVKTLVNAAAEAIPNADVMAYVADVGEGYACVWHASCVTVASAVTCQRRRRLVCRWNDVMKHSLVKSMDLCARAKCKPLLVLNKVDLLAKDRYEVATAPCLQDAATKPSQWAAVPTHWC